MDSDEMHFVHTVCKSALESKMKAFTADKIF